MVVQRAEIPSMGLFDGLASRSGSIKSKREPLRGTTESTKESLTKGANAPIFLRPNYNDFSKKDKRVSDPRSKAPVKSKSGKINPKDPRTW